MGRLEVGICQPRGCAHEAVRCWLMAALMLVGACAVPAPASAQLLSDALINAYRTNPRLDAERARLRATDEDVPRAKSGWRPTVQGYADYGWRNITTNPASTTAGETNPLTYGLTVTQPLFNGFRTDNAVSEAEASVRAARENLRLVETQTLLDAVTAYSDVVRDEAIVRLNERLVGVLDKELKAAEARRNVREITRTDEAQARARKARAVSALDTAQAELKASRATFLRVIGYQAKALVQPSHNLKLIPRNLREALLIAERESPAVIASLYREQGARHSVDKIRGELLPDLRLEAGLSRSRNSSVSITDETDASVMGRLRIPLYQGGEVSARVRQAKHTHVSRIQEIEQSRTEVEANVTAAWSRLKAARARIVSDQSQVEANGVALEGVRAEERVGQRTLLDVLNAEQELLDAQTNLARTRRDAAVAAYTLVAAIGRLQASNLNLMTDVYDSDVHYHQVRNKWMGTTITYPAGHHDALDPQASNEWMRRRPTLRNSLADQDAMPSAAPDEHASISEGTMTEAAPSPRVERGPLPPIPPPYAEPLDRGASLPLHEPAAAIAPAFQRRPVRDIVTGTLGVQPRSPTTPRVPPAQTRLRQETFRY